MNIVFICQSVDTNDPVLATTVRWIEVFANKKQVNTVDVLCLREGSHHLPSNVTVVQIGGGSKISVLWRFYRSTLRCLRQKKVDAFFVYMGGVYPILLFPMHLLFNKPIYQWKAHPHISTLMKVCVWCDTKIFTSTQSAFPLQHPKVKVVGQGANIGKFAPKPTEKQVDLIAIGRIAPVKRLEKMIQLVSYCREHDNVSYRLALYGASSDAGYGQMLKKLVQELGLESLVEFRGAIRHDIVPTLMNQAGVFLHFCDGALDKSVVEAMACGLPVLSTNPCVAEILPTQYISLLIAQDEDVSDQAQKLHRLLTMTDEEKTRLGGALREVIVQNHSDEALFDKIIAEIQIGDQVIQ